MEIYYTCKRTDLDIFPSYNDKYTWDCAERAFLVDTVTGKPPVYNTEIRILYSDTALHILFTCQDNFWISEYTERDQPLYKQDVVELFISDRDIYHYKELEQSPRNILFDADIIYHDPIHIDVNTEWDACQWETVVFFDEEDEIAYYEWKLPFESVGFSPPKRGDVWRFNTYRIDRSADGIDEYTALAHTGKIEFHVPECFAFLCFE